MMNWRSLLVLTALCSLGTTNARLHKYIGLNHLGVKSDGQLVATAIGTSVISFAGISIKRSFREIERIKELWAADTTAAKLNGNLPPIVIVKGVIDADDATGVSPATPHVKGLNSKLNTIDQPKNNLFEIAKMAKDGLIPKELTDIVKKEIGIGADDIEDVEDDFSVRTANFQGDENCVVSEVVVARLCSRLQRNETIRKTVPHKSDETDAEKARRRRVEEEIDHFEIHRPKRHQSYTVFQGRKVARGLHIVDQQGAKISLSLPKVHTIEPSPLFLPTANGIREWGGACGKRGINSGWGAFC
jgi:hypothetical protein